MKYLLFAVLIALTALSRSYAEEPSPLTLYPLHRDGGLIYTPLQNYARANGLMTEAGEYLTSEFVFGQNRVTVRTPVSAEAYQVIPVRYSLDAKGLAGKLAVSVNCFEKHHDKTCFDLNIPGKPSVRPRFLGTMTANIVPGLRNVMRPDFSDTPGVYPNYTRKPFSRSGVIEAGDIVWFKYKFTNDGDTILDPEGYGAWFYMAELHKQKSDGSWEQVGMLYNRYGRIDKYLYPGDSAEVWFSFNNCQGELNGKTPQNLGLVPGKYKVRLNFLYRWYKNIDDPLLNQWSGRGMSYYEQDFEVSRTPVYAPPTKIVTLYSDKDESRKDPVRENKLPDWLHSFEEFMSSMEIFQDIGKEAPEGSLEGTIYLQVSPWAKLVSVKLTDEKMRIAGIRIPIRINTGGLNVNYKPDHEYTLIKNGVRYPVIFTQNMADMRNHVHHTPYPEKLIWQNMLAMKECGINVIGLTAMPWLYDFIKGPYIYSQPTEECNQNGDAMKYFLDIAREEGFMVNGWGQYPFNRFSVEEVYNWLTDSSVSLERSSPMEISYYEPLLAKANGSLWLYQFRRWGDLFYETEKGIVPFDVEDTRGWMRQDINVRYPLGDKTLTAFRQWCKSKYKTIDSLNEAWGSDFTEFEDIDPEKDATVNRFGHIYEYYDQTRVFHDWSPSMADLDLFRTEARLKNYRDTLREVRKVIPGAAICIRTEGGNYIVKGLDPASPDPHIRHIYYSQRRAAVMAEVLQSSDLVRFHSDYVTMPYTPDEISYLTALGVKQGMIPIHLTQFDHMRDIALNEKYGTDYQIAYNSPTPVKGIMMHCLVAVFPWWKALYEAGGVPGATWEDFECDGVVFETQRREMKLFREKLEESMTTPENMYLRTHNIIPTDESFRDYSLKKRSYIPDRKVLK